MGGVIDSGWRKCSLCLSLPSRFFVASPPLFAFISLSPTDMSLICFFLRVIHFSVGGLSAVDSSSLSLSRVVFWFSLCCVDIICVVRHSLFGSGSGTGRIAITHTTNKHHSHTPKSKAPREEVISLFCFSLLSQSLSLARSMSLFCFFSLVLFVCFFSLSCLSVNQTFSPPGYFVLLSLYSKSVFSVCFCWSLGCFGWLCFGFVGVCR